MSNEAQSSEVKCSECDGKQRESECAARTAHTRTEDCVMAQRGARCSLSTRSGIQIHGPSSDVCEPAAQVAAEKAEVVVVDEEEETVAAGRACCWMAAERRWSPRNVGAGVDA